MTLARSLAAASILALLAGCVGGNVSGDQTVNDPDFSGVTNTDALDSSYTPDSSAL